jgi:hypothetical protein
VGFGVWSKDGVDGGGFGGMEFNSGVTRFSEFDKPDTVGENVSFGEG